MPAVRRVEQEEPAVPAAHPGKPEHGNQIRKRGAADQPAADLLHGMLRPLRTLFILAAFPVD